MPCARTSRSRPCPSRSHWPRRPSRWRADSASPARGRHERADRTERRRRRGGRARPTGLRARAVRGLSGARRRGGAERLHLGRGGAASGSWRRCSAWRRAPGGQGSVLHRRDPEPGRLTDPRGVPAAVLGHRGQPLGRSRRAAVGQDQPGRVRDGLLERELGLRTGAEPLGPLAGSRWLIGRQCCGRRRWSGALGDRHGHRRLDPPAGGAVRDRRAEADLRGVLTLRHDRLRLVARSGRDP